jgi:TadE-like protein
MRVRSSPEDGQSTVEFGVSAIVLIFILFGLIDLGRAFYFEVGLVGAAREGAREGTWFDPTSGTNPYLYDDAIRNSVDAILEQSGLPDAQLQNPGTTCPGPSDGNSEYNPPYSSSAFPPSATLDQPLLYICYASDPGLDLSTAPLDNSFKGDDLNVILVMNFGFAGGYLSGALGTVQMVANTHMSIGGF